MFGDTIPKVIQKKIATKREAKGLPPIDDEQSKKKKKDKVTIDVRMQQMNWSREWKWLFQIRKKYDVQPDYVSETGGALHPYQLEGWIEDRILQTWLAQKLPISDRNAQKACFFST